MCNSQTGAQASPLAIPLKSGKTTFRVEATLIASEDACVPVLKLIMKARFKEINSTEKLDELFQQSNEQPIVIFKHSLTCPISAGVYQEISNADADINLVVVQKARNVSTAIADKTGVRHETPQAIVLKDGKPIYHASHYDVTAADVEDSVKG